MPRWVTGWGNPRIAIRASCVMGTFYQEGKRVAIRGHSCSHVDFRTRVQVRLQPKPRVFRACAGHPRIPPAVVSPLQGERLFVSPGPQGSDRVARSPPWVPTDGFPHAETVPHAVLPNPKWHQSVRVTGVHSRQLSHPCRALAGPPIAARPGLWSMMYSLRAGGTGNDITRPAMEMERLTTLGESSCVFCPNGSCSHCS